MSSKCVTKKLYYPIYTLLIYEFKPHTHTCPRTHKVPDLGIPSLGLNLSEAGGDKTFIH